MGKQQQTSSNTVGSEGASKAVLGDDMTFVTCFKAVVRDSGASFSGRWAVRPRFRALHGESA